MSQPSPKADADTVSRRIVAEKARLDRELDALLAAQGVGREAFTAMAELGDALPPKTRQRFEELLEKDLAALPASPQLGLEHLGRVEHATIACRGLTLIRA